MRRNHSSVAFLLGLFFTALLVCLQKRSPPPLLSFNALVGLVCLKCNSPSLQAFFFFMFYHLINYWGIISHTYRVNIHIVY